MEFKDIQRKFNRSNTDPSKKIEKRQTKHNTDLEPEDDGVNSESSSYDTPLNNTIAPRNFGITVKKILSPRIRGDSKTSPNGHHNHTKPEKEDPPTPINLHEKKKPKPVDNPQKNTKNKPNLANNNNPDDLYIGLLSNPRISPEETQYGDHLEDKLPSDLSQREEDNSSLIKRSNTTGDVTTDEVIIVPALADDLKTDGEQPGENLIGKPEQEQSQIRSRFISTKANIRIKEITDDTSLNETENRSNINL
jgi:hypothetical protein